MSKESIAYNTDDRVPEGISLNNRHIYRFHKLKYLYATPSNFFQTFLDSEHSVKKSGRFCASSVNPGFFFALSQETSLYEFLYYNPQYRTPAPSQQSVEQVLKASSADPDEAFAFITCQVSVDNILDLCYLETIELVLQHRFGRHIFDRPGPRPHIADYLLSFASSSQYGSGLTDVLGQYAYAHGFNGIRFPSARAIDNVEPISYTDSSLRGSLRNFMFGDDSGLFNDLAEQLIYKATNLILFRGAYITQKAESFCVQEANKPVSWIHNELWQKDMLTIEQTMKSYGGLCTEDIDNLCNAILFGNLEITCGLGRRKPVNERNP